MHTVELLRRVVEENQILAYFIIFLGLVFEGEVTLISAGILAHLGALNFWTALVFIFAGGVLKTFLGYYIGRVLYKKYNHNKFFAYIKERVLNLMPRFKKKPFWSIFLSKFIMGINYFVVIFSGYEKVRYKTYLKAEFLSTAIWAPLLLSLGYFFSYTALHISKEITQFLLIIGSFVIGFLVLDKLVGLLYGLFEHFEDKENEE